MPTYTPKPGEIARNWHAINAEDIILDRLASQAATLLCGKHRPIYVPHIDGGNFVIVVNAPKIALTGNKCTDDIHYSHSGRSGDLKVVFIGELLEKSLRRVVERTVRGMLPKNKLSCQLIGKLRVYPGPEHPHAVRGPQPFEITQIAQ